ncbi:hypothetical protein PILCRDRAFT_9427, partial [Piloderma croceum F 1598]
MTILPIVVIEQSAFPRKEPKPEGRPAHHCNDTQSLFVNPWESFGEFMTPGIRNSKDTWAVLKEWKNSPAPSKEDYVKVAKPDWAATSDRDTWAQDIKATWLGHACFLVELPAPRDSKISQDIETPARGPRILFDPVFSNRCSPSQWIGPARYTPPPMPLKELPHVDLVILSHNHYDHTDIATLQHIYNTQPKGSVHFMCALGNQKWFESIGFDKQHVTELDWWDSRDATITLQTGASKSTLTVTCLPCQHFSGRSLWDRFHTLWASWAVEQRPYVDDLPALANKPISKIWFGGDTGLRSVPRGRKQEDMPICPVFKQIGERFGGFDLAFIPIGAFSPRFALSPVHASPDDAVEMHLLVKSQRSIGMHWGCWVLSTEPFGQDPQRLKQACVDRGVDTGEFSTLY